MLSRIALVLVADRADVGGVREQRVQRPAREGVPARTGPGARSPHLRDDSPAPEIALEGPHAAHLQVAPEDGAHRGGLRRVHAEPTLLELIAPRGHATHPPALAPAGRA